MKPDIFTYLQYRAFLKDAFALIQSGKGKVSFRGFAKKAGYSSPNFLQTVIQGQRKLSSANVVLTAKAFKLNKQEIEFFQNLVGYDQASSFDEKNMFYQRILRTKRYSEVKSLDKSQYDFFSHWYIPVVRELLIHNDFTGQSGWIAERTFPRITEAQVESAKTLLLQLGMISVDDSTGKWKQTDEVISTSSEASHIGLKNYHMSAIQLAHNAIKLFGPSERDIRSVTIGLSQNKYAELKIRMETFWKELLDFAGSQDKVESVIQVNLQIFPLTREPTMKEIRKANP